MLTDCAEHKLVMFLGIDQSLLVCSTCRLDMLELSPADVCL